MIHLDVTSAAASPVNMGVQRTVRGLYAHLKERHEITPVRWDFLSRRYAQLSTREQTFLEHPFASYQGSAGTPGQSDWRFHLGAWRDYLSRHQRGIPHETILRQGDVLLIPDLCWDPRIHSWQNMTSFSGKKIAIFHDAMPIRIPGQADSHDTLFAKYMLALHHLDLVICISHEVEDDLLGYWKRHHLELKPTQVIGWPVPFLGPRPLNPPNQKARKIIYVSRLKLRKNHLILLDACEQLWQRGEIFELDLIGIADAFTDTRKILRQVRLLAAKRRPVRWLKHISDVELTEAYRNCSFTVFPSRLEGFGLPIIESLWHGRPVICGRNGAIGEVSAGGGCLQIDQNKPGELAEAIDQLLNDESTYMEMHAKTKTRSFRSWKDYGEDVDLLLL